MPAKVYLVGAGPSDPGLFTIKGKELLSKAEVVVYDALVGDSILQMIPKTSEMINVGKRSNHHIMKQEDINELLAAKAKEGKTVVRLKGGDPFLFGRGGEELEVLIRENIPFEVVPGVPSPIAVTAYQGIPVTHRDFCSSVHIITGHRREGREYDIDFKALVNTKGTLIFLMGVASLKDICEKLMEAGMRADMPAALLMHGTRAHQDRVIATVGTLVQEVENHGAKTPAIIVVGEVCKLAEDFSWYEKTLLGGAKVLVTRPKELVSDTAKRLRALGADVLEVPAISTVKIENNSELKEAVNKIKDFDWVVFTSPTGVRIFFEELSDWKIDYRKISNVKFAVIGSGTCKELEKRGFFPDMLPEIYDGDHLGAELALKCSSGTRLLIPRARKGNEELVRQLKAVGAEVLDISTYDTVYETEHLVDVKGEVAGGEVDFVVFTSASTVKGFAAVMGDIELHEVKAICIGQQTKAAADKLGMQTFVAEKATIDSLIEKLVEIYNGGKVGGNN